MRAGLDPFWFLVKSVAGSYAVKRRFLRGRQTADVVEKQIGGVVNSTKSVDLAPDRKRIVALMPTEAREAQQSQTHVTFLENFFDELRRRAPLWK